VFKIIIPGGIDLSIPGELIVGHAVPAVPNIFGSLFPKNY
jgi:hypothetical protein